MTSKKIEQRAKEWAESTKLLPKKGQVAAAVLLRNDLLSKYSVTYARACLTEFRKASKSAGLNLRYHLRISKKAQAKVERKYAADLSKAHNGLIRIEDVESMIDKAVLGLSSDNVAIAAVSLISVTGRRPIEIMKVGKFTKVRGDNGQLMFEGQAKTKGRHVGRYAIPLPRKVAPLCIQALKKVRSELDYTALSNDDASRKYNGRICFLATKIFKEHLGRCTPKDLRKAYAVICSAKFRQTEVSQNAYISSILGHHKDDIAVSHSYIKYYLD